MSIVSNVSSVTGEEQGQHEADAEELRVHGQVGAGARGAPGEDQAAHKGLLQGGSEEQWRPLSNRITSTKRS